MLSVKIGNNYLSTEKVSFRLERTRPGSFSFVLPAGLAPTINLEEQVKIYRDGVHVFTGIVERIVRQHDPETGAEIQVSGRDLSAKLARRVIYDEILEGEPRDLVRAMCMPHLKQHTRYGVHAFDNDLYENWRYGFYLAYVSTGSGCLSDRWDFHLDQYYRYTWDTIDINYPNKIFLNYDKRTAPIAGDVYLSLILWADEGHTGPDDVWHELRFGILARYVDDNNWLAGVLYHYWAWLPYPPQQPVTHYYYESNYIQILQCLNGNITAPASQVVWEGWNSDPGLDPWKQWWRQCWVHMVISLQGNTARLWVKNLTRIAEGRTGWHEASASFDSSLSQGRIGLFTWRNAYASEITEPQYICFRYLQASKNPIADLDASLCAAEAGLAGALTRRLLWESKASQESGQWFLLDLGELKWVSRVKIVQDLENYARNWKVEVSANGSTWTQVASRSNDYSPIIDVTFSSQYIRYIKITITGSDSHKWGIAEAWAYFSDGDWLIACSDANMDLYGEPIALRVDSATALEALYRIVDTCGWCFWVDRNGNAYFKARRGSDKSNSVRFGPGYIKIMAARRDVDLRKASSRLHYEGHGATPPDERRLFVDVADSSSESTYGILARRKSGKDLIRPMALGRRAITVLGREKPTREEWALD
ncbi:MAG: discoidin domain-containing protein [Candidatus Bathyarchaeia archaeon]